MRSVGWKYSRSSVESGQPRVAKGHRAEENHVSSTSGSCTMRRPPHSGQASGASTPTSGRAPPSTETRKAPAARASSRPYPLTGSRPSPEQSAQYQAGILWPHQICRDKAQSRMVSSHSRA